MPRHSEIEGITLKNVEAIMGMENQSHHRRSVGERVADAVAYWVGSWAFVVIQSLLLAVWLMVNFIHFAWQPWDPYPFVLLNLVLSFQAAFATPIILMSENRQARIWDRRNQLDLQINLLAEQENTEQLKLLRLICERLQIPFERAGANALEQPIDPGTIIQQIVRKSDHMS